MTLYNAVVSLLYTTPVPDLEIVGAKIRKWPVQGEDISVRVKERRLWQTLMEGVDYFEQAKFYIIRGNFDSADDRLFDCEMGFSGLARKEAVDRVIETCFLQTVVHQSIDTLSKGYRHRTCLAQSLLHDPEVLVLDEPTDGLDPNQKHEVRKLIRELGKEKTIVFSTHILEEVDASCTRAMIIDQGKIVAEGSPGSLRTEGDGSLTELFRKLTTSDVVA